MRKRRKFIDRTLVILDLKYISCMLESTPTRGFFSIQFEGDVTVLSSPGLSSVVVFINSASSVLHLAAEAEDEQQDFAFKKGAKIVVDEIKRTDQDRSHYNARIMKENMSIPISQTFMELLAALSDNLKNTLPAVLKGNIITSVLINKPPSLQIALGNLIRDSKSLINQMYQFRAIYSYDEVLHFKKSAALAATCDIKLSNNNNNNNNNNNILYSPSF